MKSSAVALALSVVLTGPAVAGPGDPRFIQGALEWPPTLSGGEPFIVMRGDDGRVYYADVNAAQRHLQGALNAGNPVTVLGLEGAKPHEIIAVALGSGDAAALSLALAQAAQTTPAPPPPPPSTAPAAVPAAPPAGPAGVPPVRSEERRPARAEEARWITLRGTVYGVAGQTMFLKRDNNQVVAVDMSKLAPGSALRLRPGSPVSVIVVPVGNKYQATGFVETPAAASPPTNVPPPPAGNPPPPPAGTR